MKNSKFFGKDNSVSMDPATPGNKPLEVEDLNLELAAPVAAAAKVDDAANNKAPADQLLITAIRDSMVRNGEVIVSRVSILSMNDNEVEVMLHLPNMKPTSKGVFRLV